MRAQFGVPDLGEEAAIPCVGLDPVLGTGDMHNLFVPKIDQADLTASAGDLVHRKAVRGIPGPSNRGSPGGR